MLPEVVEYVHEGVAHLARRPEEMRVESIAPDLASPMQHTVDRLGRADGEALDAAGEACGTLGLDHEMQMIGLHGEVQDTEGRGRRVRQRCPHRGEQRVTAERREPA
jgi:hypothetical protein